MLDASPGQGDIIQDRGGVGALQPEHQKFLRNRPPDTKMEVNTDTSENLEALPPWWWNPGNPLALKPPPSVSESKQLKIRKALKMRDKRLDITFNPDRKCWQVWYYKPGFMKEAPWTNGWIHLRDFKQHQNSDYVLQTVIAMDQTNKPLKTHYNEVKQKRVDDLERCRAQRRDDASQIAGEVYDHSLIRVGYGKSNGSKSVNFG